MSVCVNFERSKKMQYTHSKMSSTYICIYGNWCEWGKKGYTFEPAAGGGCKCASLVLNSYMDFARVVSVCEFCMRPTNSNGALDDIYTLKANTVWQFSVRCAGTGELTRRFVGLLDLECVCLCVCVCICITTFDLTLFNAERVSGKYRQLSGSMGEVGVG